jgi:hypothetical protein
MILVVCTQTGAAPPYEEQRESLIENYLDTEDCRVFKPTRKRWLEKSTVFSP